MESANEPNPLDELLSLIPSERRQIAIDYINQMADINILIEKLRVKIRDGTATTKNVTVYYSGTRAYSNLSDKLLKMLPGVKDEETEDDLLKFLKRYS